MAGVLALFGFGGGSASASSGGGVRSASAAPSYSFQRLEQLYERLCTFRERDLERGQSDALIEIVRQITEALIWGEQNDPNLFDFFCEKNILADLIRVLGLSSGPKPVKVQLLQTVSMLLQNVRRETSLYYLLSNNYINRLISTQLDFQDEEILAYYITLLKSLAMRLDTTTIKCFMLTQPELSFPLYNEATKFFAHRDQMVRATVRSVTLQIYRLEDDTMRKFVLRHSSDHYFSLLANHLRDLWMRLGSTVTAGAIASGANVNDVDIAGRHENELSQDLLIYLSDVFELGVKELNDVLADRLLTCALFPVVLAGLASPGGRGGHRSEGRTPQPLEDTLVEAVSPVVALFILRQVLDTLRASVLLEPLLSALVQPFIPRALAVLLHTSKGKSAPPQNADKIPNAIRDNFIQCLRSESDGLILYSVAVLHSAVRKRLLLPAGFFETAGILPVSNIGGSALPIEGSPRSPSKTSSRTDIAMTDIMLALLRGIEQHYAWHLDTVQVLCRALTDILLEPPFVARNIALQATMYRAVQEARAVAGRRLLDLLQESNDDGILDTFFVEWELCSAALIDVAGATCQIRRLRGALSSLAAPSQVLRPSLRRPPSSSTESTRLARKAARSFLVLRRTASNLSKYASRNTEFQDLPWGRANIEPFPFETSRIDIDENPTDIDLKLVTNKLREGMPVEVKSMNRIVCGITVPSGKQTRYLLLHDSSLLLAQPDLASPGWMVIRTLWPLYQVHSMIDRSDPRTLRLGIHGRRGVPGPGEAVVAYLPPASPEYGEENISVFFTITLNFEDVQRCYNADMHLQERRKVLRSELMAQTRSFVAADVASCCNRETIS